MRQTPGPVFEKEGFQDEDGVAVKGDELWRILTLLRCKWRLLGMVILTIAHGASPFLVNFVTSEMMTIMAEQGGFDFLDAIAKLCLKQFYCVVAMGVLAGIASGCTQFLGPRLLTALRDACYSSLMELDVEYYDSHQTGTLVGRLSEDVVLVQETYIGKGSSMVQFISQSVVGVLLAVAVSWRVSIVCFPSIIVAAAVYIVGQLLAQRRWSKFHEEFSAGMGKAEEVISQFRTVKAFDCELYEVSIYSNSLNSIREVHKATSWIHGIKDGLIQLILYMICAEAQYYTIWTTVRKPYLGLESGDWLVIQMSMTMSTQGISQALALVESFKKASRSAAKLLHIIDLEPNVHRHDGETRIHGRTSARGKIEFRDVGFRYARSDTFALRHLSFVIEAGQTVAFVGESGCGKSTTLQLLQRLYEIQEGQILIDDVDIRDLAPSYIRSLISSVTQTPVLFSMSIGDNIRYARPDASDDAVAEAARTGNAHDFIMDLPERYETMVQQSSLSGGQKQRICISRAILHNAPILLLDEATAALDTQSEQLVQRSLEEVRHGKTAVLVAHRLATVKSADVIFVFKDGHIVETGGHEELLAYPDGLYADLVRFQLQ
jgi:ABC-type multidrug transport system fused ATPase/permease subunit